MVTALLMLATLSLGAVIRAEGLERYVAPAYSAASIVNSATWEAGVFAPNSLATIFGSNLAYSTASVLPSHVASGAMPNTLAGVRVYVDGITASLYYVSPNQINFVIPSRLLPGESEVWIAREGTSGPTVRIKLSEAVPAVFRNGADWILATRVSGEVISRSSPARPGEWIVLYATGLGRTDPDVVDGRLVISPAQIRKLEELQVLVDWKALPRGKISYAGVAPGFAGLYQINLQLPDELGRDPEVRILIGDRGVSAALRLATGSE